MYLLVYFKVDISFLVSCVCHKMRKRHVAFLIFWTNISISDDKCLSLTMSDEILYVIESFADLLERTWFESQKILDLYISSTHLLT